MFAKGEYIVFHDDNCRLYPDWIERHVKWLEQGYLVAGNWLSYQEIDTNGKGVIGVYGWEHRSKMVKEPKIVSGGWLYGGNFSFPLRVAIDINGFDERCDGEMGQDDVNFGIRAERRGYRTMYDPHCCLEYYLVTHNNLIGYVAEQQKLIELDIQPVNIRLRDGKEHFSNEFLTQELVGDRSRYLPRGNNFNLVDIRKIVIEKEYNTGEIYKILEGYIDPDLKDWRDGKLISDKIKGTLCKE